MKRKDIVIGFLIILLVFGVIYQVRRKRPNKELVVPETLSSSIEEKLEEKFKIEIPEDVSKAELKDVSGGDSSGIATRKFENGVFSQTIIADLPEIKVGSFYQGWLVRGETGSENFSQVSTGQLIFGKGGWTLNFESKKDYSDHTKVIVTLETKADNTPEKVVLEGNF